MCLSKIKIIFLNIALALSTSIFALDEPKKDMPIVTEDKPVISVNSQQPTFIIKLQSNPSTGYSWFLRDYNANLIEPIKQSYEAPTATKGLVGAPGFELWTFKIKSPAFVVPQQLMIRFVYARPFETAENSKQWIVKVVTEKKPDKNKPQESH